MKLKILKNNGIMNLPEKLGDAGYDVIASKDPVVKGSIYQGIYYTSIHHIEYDTEIKIEPEKINGKYDFFLLMYPRSSIIRTNLILSNSVGVIDSGYRGGIKVCFKYISQPEDLKIIKGKDFEGNDSSGIVTSINPQRVYKKGDKIAQIVPCKHNEISIEYSEELGLSDRGESSFGSTGK